jgi:hypothetical protein
MLETERSTTMECPECGAVVTADDLFCGECGAILSVAPLAEAEGLPQAAPQAAGETTTGEAAGAPIELPPPPADSPAHAAPVRDARANAAFVLGIFSLISIVLSCLPVVGFAGCFGPLAGIAAIILGIIARRDLEAWGGPEEDIKRAQQGLKMGIAGLILYIGLIVLGFIFGIGFSILEEL